ncbi:hypothetical protein BK128_21480 [Viridibacillus sp. FSL H7-0596]|uniref:hypothetical protein n=1 Tax=Viridibacillus sp. FSL H7-0596 TaxID=1928923 RepID=UPI00096F5B4D|nr:hypothetical protein [Viridibacillus sp. FSL H7-0596]OMC81844.1 hypothetical protein BK128_21480 [Viridibacillus sp. FSL H7-0596]
MKQTEKLNLKKPDLTDYVNISDLNENMDIIDAAVGDLKKGNIEIDDLQTNDKTLAGAINEVKNDLTTHVDDATPHQFTDATDKKTYEYGFKTNAAKDGLIFVYNEVTI